MENHFLVRAVTNMVTVFVGWMFLHLSTYIGFLEHLGVRIDENEVIVGASSVVIGLVVELVKGIVNKWPWTAHLFSLLTSKIIPATEVVPSDLPQ